jgi:hypothetical protein
MKIFLNNNWLKLVAIAMLLGALVSSFSALFTLPFAYYQLMNWAVAGAALMIVWQAYKSRKLCLMWLFALVAVVFNPIGSIYLSAFAWQIADIIVVVLFAVSFFLMKEKKS